MNNFIRLLLYLSGFLVLVNFLLLMEFEPVVNRWGRILSTLTFLALFLKDFHRNKFLLMGAFLLFFTADFFALTYQETSSQQAFFALQSLAYLCLVYHTGKRLVKQKFKSYQTIYFSIVFLLNTFFMLVVGHILAEEVQDPMVEALFYVYGLSAIVLISTGILYYDRFPDNLSASFLISVVGLVLSNLMGFPAHFIDFWEFFYLDRLFYVLGMAGLVSFSYYSGKVSFSSKRFPKDHL